MTNNVISERELTSAVIECGRMLGFLVAHFRPSRTSSGGWVTAVQGDGKGFPDLVLAGGGHVVFAELKVMKGRLAEQQLVWRDTIESCPGVTYRLWTDVDWWAGAIEEQLRSLKGRT